MEVSLADISSIPVADSSHLGAVTQNLPNQKTQVISEKANSKGLKLPLMLGIIALLTVAGGSLGYVWRLGLLSKNPEPEETGEPEEITSSPEPTSKIDAQRLTQIDKGWLINAKTKLNISKSTLPPADEDIPSKQPLPLFAPPTSLLQVVEKQQNPSSQDYWLQIKVCSIGDAQGVVNSSGSTSTTGTKTILKPGEQVWLKSSELTPTKASVSNPTTIPEQCSTADSSAPNIEDSSISLPVDDSLAPIQPSIRSTPPNKPGRTILPQTGNNTDSTNR